MAVAGHYGAALAAFRILEAGGNAVGEHLTALGHDVQWWPQFVWKAGAMCAIRKDPESGLVFAGADPRRASYALGW